MNPEDRAWERLRQRGAAQIHPGFADRVMAAARAGRAAAMSPLGRLALSAATAALCYLAVTIFQTRTMQAEDSHNLSGWQQIVSATDEIALNQ